MKKIKKKPPHKQKKKQAQKQLETQTEQLLNHPTECCICATSFERTVETVQEWMVTVREERVHLTCPRCWKIITEAMESLDGDHHEEEREVL